MNREIRITQRFDAPVERVFDAWLDPAVAGRWLFATAARPPSQLSIDARPGGSFRVVEGRDGSATEHAGKYLEITRPRRLVFTLAERGHARDAGRVSVEIAPVDSGCELTLRHERARPDEARPVEGRWLGMLYGLGEAISRRGGGTSGRRGA